MVNFKRTKLKINENMIEKYRILKNFNVHDDVYLKVALCIKKSQIQLH